VSQILFGGIPFCDIVDDFGCGISDFPHGARSIHDVDISFDRLKLLKSDAVVYFYPMPSLGKGFGLMVEYAIVVMVVSRLEYDDMLGIVHSRVILVFVL
jgi:hypothetical protein